MDGVVAYILGKSYTKKSLIGIGALAGAPCQVQSINKVNKTTTITLKWEDNVGGVHTQSFDIEDDGTPIDCGQVLPQYDTMPSPSASNVGQILQYIGTSTSSYTNGYFYECRFDGTNYSWVQKNVQPNGGGTGSDNVVEGYFNESDDLFYEEISYINPITGAENVIYISLDTNLLYRYDTANSIFIRVDEHADGQTIQVTVMPTADSSQLDKVYQFIGTTGTYVNGGFYKCIYDSGTTTYSWTRILVDDVYTKSEIGTLSDLPDTTQNVIQNIATIKLDIDQLQASKMDIDGSNCAQTVTFNKVQQGNSAVATGDYSHAEGNFTEAIGIYSHAEGGTSSTQGMLARTTAYGESSHAEGKGTSASGVGSHSEGGSHAEGVSTIAGQNYQHVSGKYNDNKTDTLFEIGNGSKNGFIVNRSNAFEVYENGDVNYTGTLKQNGVDILSIKTDLADLASAFDNTASYAVGDYTVYSGGIYRCINAHTGDWDSNDFTLVAITDELKNKVDKIAGKGLSTNDFTDALKDKVIALEPIYLIGSGLNLDRGTGKLTATGMAIPIDSNLSNVSTNPVQNKVIALSLQTLQGSVLGKANKVSGATANNFAALNSSGNLIDSGISKNIVPSNASSANKLLTEADKLSDGNGIDINEYNVISLDVSYLTASRIGYIPTTEKGATNGVATLVSGKVPAAQLPSYVDDVIEGYYYTVDKKFYEDASHTIEITGEVGKIYVSLDTNKTYRWTGSAYVEISAETYTDGDGINIASGVISVDEMSSADMNDVIDPAPLPIDPYMGNPTGCIIQMMGITAPTGYLECDGQVYNISAYTRLANYFESQFGLKNYFGGDGTTTFAVPDLKGEFLRGSGTNSHTTEGSGASVED